MIKAHACSVTLVLVLACTSKPPSFIDVLPPPKPVPADAGTDAEAACARLVALGCPEGSPKPPAHPCTRVIAETRSEGILVDTACLAAAADQVAVRACGSTGTMRVRCKE